MAGFLTSVHSLAAAGAVAVAAGTTKGLAETATLCAGTKGFLPYFLQLFFFSFLPRLPNKAEIPLPVKSFNNLWTNVCTHCSMRGIKIDIKCPLPNSSGISLRFRSVFRESAGPGWSASPKRTPRQESCKSSREGTL